MNINKLIAKLLSKGIKAVPMTLQVLQCKDGSTPLTYSTYRKANKHRLFGSDIEVTTTCIDTSTPQGSNDKLMFTTWVSDNAQDYEQIGNKYGFECIVIVTDGQCVPHTLAQAQQLIADDSTTEDVSEPVSASF